MTFRVGQLVVCVEDTWDDMGNDIGPYKGQVLTIRTIDKGICKGRVELCLRFEEIVNKRRKFSDCWFWQRAECQFWARAFRPIATPSIEVFQAMLTSSKQSERV